MTTQNTLTSSHQFVGGEYLVFGTAQAHEAMVFGNIGALDDKDRAGLCLRLVFHSHATEGVVDVTDNHVEGATGIHVVIGIDVAGYHRIAHDFVKIEPLRQSDFAREVLHGKRFTVHNVSIGLLRKHKGLARVVIDESSDGKANHAEFAGGIADGGVAQTVEPFATVNAGPYFHLLAVRRKSQNLHLPRDEKDGHVVLDQRIVKFFDAAKLEGAAVLHEQGNGSGTQQSIFCHIAGGYCVAVGIHDFCRLVSALHKHQSRRKAFICALYLPFLSKWVAVSVKGEATEASALGGER